MSLSSPFTSSGLISRDSSVFLPDTSGYNTAACGCCKFTALDVLLQCGDLVLHLLCLTDHRIHVLRTALVLFR